MQTLSVSRLATVTLLACLCRCVPEPTCPRRTVSRLSSSSSTSNLDVPTMDVIRAIHSRSSIREYTSQPVLPQDYHAIVEAANRAPSAGNLQGYSIVSVTNPDLRRRLSQAALDQTHVLTAPLTLVFLADPNRSGSKYGSRGRDLYSVQDATIACAYAQLAAHALGYGTVWTGAFDEAAVAQVVRSPWGLKAVALLSIGRPAEVVHPSYRRVLSDIVKQETF
eukprot:RCo039169